MIDKHERDPAPGDFDAELAEIDDADLSWSNADSKRRLVIQFTVQSEDAVALERIAQQRGQEPGEVVTELIRSAAGQAA